MSGLRIAGLALVVVGVVVLMWGGVFWTEKNTVLDAGPVEVQTEQQKGFALPPVLGGLALIGGIVLMVVPSRRRA